MSDHETAQSPPDPPRSNTLTVLKTRGPLMVKQIYLNEERSVDSIEQYDNAKYFLYTRKIILNIIKLYELIKILIAQPRMCLIYGDPAPHWPEGRKDRRLAKNILTRDVDFFIGDLDKVQIGPWDPQHFDPDDIINRALKGAGLNFLNGVKVVWVLSASAGLESNPEKISLRIFAWLARPIALDHLYNWAKCQNETVDPRIYIPSQAIYIGRPIVYCHDETELPDEQFVQQRCGLLEGSHDELDYDFPYEIEEKPQTRKKKTKRQVTVRTFNSNTADPIVQKLKDGGWYIREMEPGKHAIRCSREEDHSTLSCESSTVYFEPGYGGEPNGGFKCQHASHDDMHLRDLIDDLDERDYPSDLISDTKEAGLDAALENVNFDANDLVKELAQTAANHKLDEYEQDFLIESALTHRKEKGKKTALANSVKKRLKQLRCERRAIASQRQVGLRRILDPKSFPDVKEDNRILCTVDNLLHLLDSYGIGFSYDEIKKNPTIQFPYGYVEHPDLSDEGKLQHLRSLCALNGVSKDLVDYLLTLFMQSAINPILDWIRSKPWDRVDRLQDLAASVTVAPDHAKYWADILRIWLIQCFAALDGAKSTPRSDALPKYENILILQGDQGVHKTSWFRALLPSELQDYFGNGLCLDVEDRDSVKVAVSKWLTELGELDATFRRADVARLKAFMSHEDDEFRLPYARTWSKFRRRTSFCASVNQTRFLTDTTGNRRFLPFVALNTNPAHGIDMQQVWAQVDQLYRNGEQWWPDDELDKTLETLQRSHTLECPVEDALMTVFNLDKNDVGCRSGRHYTCSELLDHANLQNNRFNLNRAGEVMRAHNFKLATVQGRRGYYVINRTTGEFSDLDDK